MQSSRLCKLLLFDPIYALMAQEIRVPAGPLITQFVPWGKKMSTNTCSLEQLNWKQENHHGDRKHGFKRVKACWSVFIWILFYFIYFQLSPKGQAQQLHDKK